jgi:hypothetical protein
MIPKLKLLSQNITSPTLVVYLVGLWCPDAVKHKLASAVRRMLCQTAMKKTEEGLLGGQ